jgi:hypothetical protein
MLIVILVLWPDWTIDRVAKDNDRQYEQAELNQQQSDFPMSGNKHFPIQIHRLLLDLSAKIILIRQK